MLESRRSFTIWSVLLIILVNSVNIDAARTSSSHRSSSKARQKPNPDHYKLSYGSNTHQQPARQHQVHQQQNAAPSAPQPEHKAPIGWNVPNTQTQHHQPAPAPAPAQQNQFQYPQHIQTPHANPAPQQVPAPVHVQQQHSQPQPYQPAGIQQGIIEK